MPHTYWYEIISPATNWHHLGWHFCGLAHRETPPPVAGGRISCQHHLYWAKIQRTEEENERDTKNETIIQCMQLYKRISPTIDLYSLIATLRWIRCMGKPHLQWQVVKSLADAVCTGPRSKEKRRKETRNIQNNPVSIFQLPNQYPTEYSYPYLIFCGIGCYCHH